MTTKDTNWYARLSEIFFIKWRSYFTPFSWFYRAVLISFFLGEFPKGILCILTNVTTSKQRCLLQDIIKHGHSTCTRGHTGECCHHNVIFEIKLNGQVSLNRNLAFGVSSLDVPILHQNQGICLDNLEVHLSAILREEYKAKQEKKYLQ